jgi:hypothetical protein
MRNLYINVFNLFRNLESVLLNLRLIKDHLVKNHSNWNPCMISYTINTRIDRKRLRKRKNLWTHKRLVMKSHNVLLSPNLSIRTKV